MTTVRNVPVAETRFLLREHGGGDGTPVVLLHGVPETSSAWKDIAPGLAEGRRVLCPDLPGLGGSAYSGPFDVASVVGQLMALLDVELPGQRIDLVGHDFGGSIALAMVGAHPDRFRSLVVANAPFRKVPALRAGHIPFFALPVAPELLFRLGGPHVVDVMFKLAWKGSRSLDPEVKAEYTAAYTDPGRVKAMLGYYRAVARPRVAAAVTRRRAPRPPQVRAERMLVLWGAADPVLPIWVGESVQKDLGSDCAMITVPKAGHFVLEEAPEVCLAALQELLAEQG
ncbi:MAG: fluoroacetate dehalogenase [Frankiales bacterium]|nr:fluoroacetate dehalogenase [Frankiales bacterium]